MTFDPKYVMSFDVESVGLHGEGFAVGWVVIDLETGKEVEYGLEACGPGDASGTGSDRDWVRENVPTISAAHGRPIYVRDAFWNAWEKWRREGAVLVADCLWPVEARFLSDCIRDDPGRDESGPYPLIDIAPVLWAADMDPLGTYDRLEGEEAHNPLGDARQSARIMEFALKRIAKWRAAYHVGLAEAAEEIDGGINPEDLEAAVDKYDELEAEARRDPGS